jgi:hypothetical protein
MYGVLLGLIMGAVGWVVVWSVFEPGRNSKYWWPFTMKEPPGAPSDAAASATPWRRSRHVRPAEPPKPAHSDAKTAKQPWQRRSNS